MKWVQASDLETRIILALGKSKKSQAEIAREINHDPKSVGKTVSRLEEQEIMTRSKSYSEDARISLIELDNKKIRIKKTHEFYQRFFIIQIIVIISGLLFSFFMENLANSVMITISTILSIIPSSAYMIHKVYITKDKVSVYKKTRERKKSIKNNNADTQHQLE